VIQMTSGAPTAIVRDGVARPYFTELQVLGASDLMALGSYLRDMRRRHNLGPHTWGIVAGLELREVKDDLGAPEVYVSPGVAIDGFGREIVLLDPYRLSARHFEHIPFDAGMAEGQDVPVWIAYAERRTQPPRPGFEACTDTDEGRRIVETFRIEVGGSAAELRDRLQHNRDFGDPPPVHTRVPPDGSVPDQRFPDEEPPARWAIQLGVVRWKPSDGTVGTSGEAAVGAFASPAVAAPGRRPMAGLVGAELLAPEEGVVVRRRGNATQPRDPVFRKSVLGVVDQATFADDVHVYGETHLRAPLALHQGAPADDEVPLTIARHRTPAAGGNPERADIWLAIGKPAGKKTGLVVGPVENNGPKPVLTVSDDNKVGVPTGSLTVGEALTAKRLTVTENADVERDLKVKGKTKLEGDLTIDGDTRIGSPAARSNLEVAGNLVVGAGGNASIVTRHINGKNHVTDAEHNLFLNYSNGMEVHVGGLAPSTLRVSGDLFVRGVKVPVDVQVGSRTLNTPMTAQPERTGVHAFSLTSRLPIASSAQMMVALSDIQNLGQAINARWEIGMEGAPVRNGDNTFEFRVRWRVHDTDGQILKISYVAVFAP
jgi:hypothetical protein